MKFKNVTTQLKMIIYNIYSHFNKHIKIIRILKFIIIFGLILYKLYFYLEISDLNLSQYLKIILVLGTLYSLIEKNKMYLGNINFEEDNNNKENKFNKGNINFMDPDSDEEECNQNVITDYGDEREEGDIWIHNGIKYGKDEGGVFYFTTSDMKKLEINLEKDKLSKLWRILSNHGWDRNLVAWDIFIGMNWPSLMRKYNIKREVDGYDEILERVGEQDFPEGMRWKINFKRVKAHGDRQLVLMNVDASPVASYDGVRPQYSPSEGEVQDVQALIDKLINEINKSSINFLGEELGSFSFIITIIIKLFIKMRKKN